jgi:aryl-alcohol dehydrogenase-like predicted oxidoreductase
METRRLGRTGHHSTVAILGGAAFARCSPEDAERGFRMAIERGVNHLDIAPSYGHAEVVVGPHVPAVRDRLFVADKTTRRNPDGVKEQLEETLRRLGTDHLDLYQMHAVTTLEVLDERSGAAEVILAAREQGLCRFAGITGHDLTAPATFVEALRRYDLDTVMFPIYPRVWNDPDYRRDAEALLAICAERDLGVMVIKAAAQRPWGEREKWAESWYEPGHDEATIRRGVRFALSTPGVHGFCTPGDLGVLPHVLDAAEAYEPMTDAERDAAMAEMAGEEVIFPIAANAR